MGGATSKLKENDWEKADGKLRGSEFTVDGADATKKYAIYYLTKRGVNQREFDVTDEESNLLFTTKQVPGTIACFDILGKGIDEYVLRVTVDIARRYWTVYRYDIPAFPGQLPDKTATQKLAAERIEAAEKAPDLETFQTPLLYKKACIVVSWSRYMAVSVLYGPPTPRMVQNYKDVMEELEKEEEEKSLQRSRLRAQSSEMSVNSEKSAGGTRKMTASSVVEEENGEDVDGEEQSHDNNDSSGPLETPHKASATSEKQGDSLTPERLFSDNATPFLPEEKKVPLRKTLRTWIRQKSKTIREQYFDKDKRKSLVDPSEGIMHLEKPLLLCQEIYTRIIGNHQTSLVSKETVLELLKQDNAQHAAEHPDDADDSYSPIMTTDDDGFDEGIEVGVDGAALFPEGYPPMIDASSNGEQEHTEEAIKESQEPEDIVKTLRSGSSDGECPSSPGNGVSEQKEAVLVDDDGEQEEEIIQIPEEDQPIVGYWLWENTLRTHKVKMYVAKGTDLALHVVLAILTNQVRYERNAIAMTI